MERNVKCRKCGILFKAGQRGAVPEFCASCRPLAYKKRYYHYKRKPVEDFPASHLIRPQILERDNFTCQECGSQKRLDVHHKDGNNYRKVGDNANNKFDNLVTLCHKCHMRLHPQKNAKRGNLVLYYERYPTMSYAALGRVFKLSRERVRQILTKDKGK